MNYNYGSKRLDDLAKNILFGMELVDKRVDTLKGKKAKKTLTEEEELMAMKETNDFFEDKNTQKKLEYLKKLIVDNSYRDRLNELYKGASATPQSRLDEMNMTVSFNPYDVKE